MGDHSLRSWAIGPPVRGGVGTAWWGALRRRRGRPR